MSRAIVLKDGRVALVDDADFERVSAYRWASYPTGHQNYIKATAPNRNDKPALYLHRFILGAAVGEMVDHINGDEFDNRRANLRLCNASQNMRNRRVNRSNASGFKGVLRRRQRFVARIAVNGKTLHLGGFATAEEAAHAYDRAALTHFGEFAWLNFPPIRHSALDHDAELSRDLFEGRA